MEKRMVCKCEDEEIDRSKLHAFKREGEGGFMGNVSIFSRKHYVAIGNILKEYGKLDSPVGNHIINDFIRMLKEDNPNFDTAKFANLAYGR